MTNTPAHEKVLSELLLAFIVAFKKKYHYYPNIRTCVEHFTQEGVNGLRSTCTVKLRFDVLINQGDVVRVAPRSPTYYVPFLERKS